MDAEQKKSVDFEAMRMDEVKQQIEVHEKLRNELLKGQVDANTLIKMGDLLKHGPDTRDFPKLTVHQQQINLQAFIVKLIVFISHLNALLGPNAPHERLLPLIVNTQSTDPFVKLHEHTESLRYRVDLLTHKKERPAPHPMTAVIVGEFLQACRKNGEKMDHLFTWHVDFLRLLNVQQHKDDNHPDQLAVSQLFLEMIETLQKQNMGWLQMLKSYTK